MGLLTGQFKQMKSSQFEKQVGQSIKDYEQTYGVLFPIQHIPDTSCTDLWLLLGISDLY